MTAIAILGAWPSTIDWVAITLISIGVYAVSLRESHHARTDARNYSWMNGGVCRVSCR